MATASNATTSAGETSGSNVPQWKRDLIQRRRQQSKVLGGNGVVGGKPCSSAIGPSTTESVDAVAGSQERCCVAGDASSRTRTTSNAGTEEEEEDSVNGASNGGSGGSAIAGVVACSSVFFSRGPACGAIVSGGAAAATVVGHGSTVACNMRLEADPSFRPDSEDVANGTPGKSSTDTDGISERAGDGSESENGKRNGSSATGPDERRARGGRTRNGGKIGTEMASDHHDDDDDDDDGGESDSSEELRYGPGIVNKLKSKYLNLTLRETSKSRVTVQRFRRAASLEDLLDCDDEPGEKSARKYGKRATSGAAAKTDRYRNVTRGNESMKRARSVEALTRYNGTDESSGRHDRLAATSNGPPRQQEPVNNRVVLVDRTAVKIESRLAELDRPKPVNKPKRIKPLLAETERPPPDLVKTTMRIFEGGSAKKLKPKGEVAAKVATFKTINDTFKAQTQKKVVPKPPIQPKPFANGNARAPPGSPKRIVAPSQKPTAESIEERQQDGVIAEPIAQSVSSVVSKFQRIERSHSPSPSPEPSLKSKFSPAPSPEPQSGKSRSSPLEIGGAKSPPVTPVLSPRIASPRLPASPLSPTRDPCRQVCPRVHSPPSPNRDHPGQMSEPAKVSRGQTEEDGTRVAAVEHPRQRVVPADRKLEEIANDEPATTVPVEHDDDDEEERCSVADEKEKKEEEEEEVVDAPKTISKAALENIGRTGVTMQFSFNGKPTANKSYLPGFKRNGQKPAAAADDIRDETTNSTAASEFGSNKSFLPGAVANAATDEREAAVSRLRERLEPERRDNGRIEDREEDGKPVGAVCSLGLIRSSTTTSYPQGNESKTIRCQKTESPPQKQIGIIRPLVSTKTQHPQQNLSNRELEKNLINRAKSIEQPTKVVVSLKSAEEIQPAKKSGSGGTGLWETKPWNQQNNTMVFNFSNRKDVPDYIENDGLIVRKKREKPKVGDGGIIVLDATLDASTTDDAEWELAGGPPSPCDVSFFNDNVLINGRSNLSRTPRNHKHRIQFDDTATRTFEYPSEASMLEGESSVDGETSGSVEQSPPISNKTTSTSSTASMPSLLGGGGLAMYTPSKVDLTSEGFELGVTRAVSSTPVSSTAASSSTPGETESETEVDYLKPAQDAGAWGSETTGDLLY